MLSSEHQIKQAVTQFASLHNRNLVAYDDFCDSLDIAQFAREQVGSDEAGYGGLYTQLERRQIDNESVRHSQPSSSQKVKQHPEAAHYSSPPASTHLKASLEDLEPGSESVMKGPETTITSTVAQPKLSDSIIFKRTGVPTRSHHVNKQRSLDTYYDDSELSTNSRYSTDDAYRYTSHVSDRERITNRDSRLFIPPRFRDRVPTSPSRARVSPSKVGSVLWGANTPLRQKGVPPVLQEGLWCCAVCLYMENPHHARKCAVCDSFNHGITEVSLYLI